MALNPMALDYLLSNARKGQAIAAMGYPDILVNAGHLRERMGDKILELKYRPDSEAICKRHSIKVQDIPDAESLFEIYGCTLDVFDIVAERGGEHVIDLNYPIPDGFCGQFDWVLDVGTLEHCFNAPQALMNMAALVKVGGYVIHENPFNWGNHGFWNLNPTLFHDFYTDNGFHIVECFLIDRATGKVAQPSMTGRFKYPGGEANILTIAYREEEKPFTMPTQTKYRKKNNG